MWVCMGYGFTYSLYHPWGYSLGGRKGGGCGEEGRYMEQSNVQMCPCYMGSRSCYMNTPRSGLYMDGLVPSCNFLVLHMLLKKQLRYSKENNRRKNRERERERESMKGGCHRFLNVIQICAGITSGRVLNGALYAQRLQTCEFICIF